MDGVSLVGARQAKINNVQRQLERFPPLRLSAGLADERILSHMIFHPGPQQIVGTKNHGSPALASGAASHLKPFQIFLGHAPSAHASQKKKGAEDGMIAGQSFKGPVRIKLGEQSSE